MPYSYMIDIASGVFEGDRWVDRHPQVVFALGVQQYFYIILLNYTFTDNSIEYLRIIISVWRFYLIVMEQDDILFIIKKKVYLGNW